MDDKEDKEEKEINELQEDDVNSDGDVDSVNVVDSDDDLDSEIDEIDDIEKIQQINESEQESNFDLLNQDNDKFSSINIDDESDEEYDDEYYQKFTHGINNNYLDYFHSETNVPNYMEIDELSKVIRDKNNVIIDDNHRTVPILTKYEKTKVLGQRAKQINSGNKPYINVSENIIDGYIIAELELKEKKIPFIIRRPLPNGKSEYWKIKDLEIYY
jgi:DNA-directed RNA polymerase subunit K/omega